MPDPGPAERGVDPAGPSPSPSWTPAEVVGHQLAGLRSEPRTGRGAGPGARLTWMFASPGNRAATGPLERFVDMLRSEPYAGLLEHRAAQLGPVVQRGDAAQLEVLVITADDRAEGYTWVLIRESAEPYRDCWLTDGVLRHPEQGATSRGTAARGIAPGEEDGEL